MILVMANAYLIWVNITQQRSLERFEQENQALTAYMETMQDKIRQYESDQDKTVEIPKTVRIRELLDSYMRDRDRGQVEIESTISTEELRNDLEDYQLKQRFIPNIVPVKDEYVVSKEFSDRHKAIDLAAPLGAEVAAAASGVIKSVYEDKYFGNVVVIDHLNRYVTFYAHLAKSFHQPGFFVEKGQTIGLVGSSGFSKSPHLHYEIIYRGENINPREKADYR